MPHPRKRFGQHFLHDQNILHKMVDYIAPQEGEHLVEIGPGQGALTQHLLPLASHLDIIEIDRDLVPLLEQQYADYPQLHIYNQDVLQFDWPSLVKDEKKLRVIGNLPYNISTPLLFRLFNHANIIQDMFFLLQKEVVDRLCANVGSSHYGRLSIMAQYYCHNEMLFTVGPEVFNPPPKVDSAYIHMQPREQPEVIATDIEQLRKVVTEAFSHRRKTLHNALKRVIDSVELKKIGINPMLRPQEISVAEYVKISNLLVKGS